MNRRNVPSMVQLSKHNLNQIAAQSMCLFRNIPFILRDYMKDLQEVWPCIENLLTVVQIIYTTTILEQDLIDLKGYIRLYLREFIHHYCSTLIPKQHFLTHYPTIIRRMRTVKHMSTIRFEAYHQLLKSATKMNRNYKNLPKTVALKHQMMYVMVAQSMKSFSKAKTTSSKRRPIFEEELAVRLPDDAVFEVKWMQMHNRKYDNGLIILHNKKIYEINRILYCAENYFFWTTLYCVTGRDRLSNSIKIVKFEPEIHSMIKFDPLDCQNVYERKKIEHEMCIAADCLEIARAFEKTL